MSELTSKGANALTIADFSLFYEAIHDQKPFQWQSDLASQVLTDGWPDIIDVPTASGKTAAIDIAVFATAMSASPDYAGPAQSRRVFFTVDRRLVVNQAYNHAKAELAEKLWDAAAGQNEDAILRSVAENLVLLAGGNELWKDEGHRPPLDVRELRGGIYRDDAWIRSPLQPTVIATTVDQVGSRLLFRGYGTSERTLPIHAAMTGCDSLIILDEAHCSKPFGDTVDSIIQYQSERWADQTPHSPLKLVQMTATRGNVAPNKSIFKLTKDHYAADEALRRRHGASKPVRLVLDEKASGKTMPKKLAVTMIGEAEKLIESGCQRIAIIVNRVHIAKEVHRVLTEKGRSADLLIGRMRPLDRESYSAELQRRFAAQRQQTTADKDSPQILVATQTIEVGVDFDFDGMVTQCASFDALTQRFGRLNRLGKSPHCHGVIVAPASDIVAEKKLSEEKSLDPIYGNALCRTWHTLSELANDASEIDFGVQRDDSILKADAFQAESPRLDECITRGPEAPVLMPSHVDMLVQTSPRPAIEPDVAALLHGLGPDGEPISQPTVQICWRADLKMPTFSGSKTGNEPSLHQTFRGMFQDWLQAIELCPPTSAECMSVPLSELRIWLRGGDLRNTSGDVESEEQEELAKDKKTPLEQWRRFGLIWRGGFEAQNSPSLSSNATESKTSSRLASSEYSRDYLSRIQPNDTIVLPAQFGGWQCFGHVPQSPEDPSDNSNDPKQRRWKGIEQLLAEADATKAGKLRTEVVNIDIADEAYKRTRGQWMIRLHPNLPISQQEQKLRKRIENQGVSGSQINLSAQLFRESVKWITASGDSESNTDESTQNSRIGLASSKSLGGTLAKYEGGFVWRTKIDPTLLQGSIPPLPIESLGDEFGSREAIEDVTLIQHLSDVAHVARFFAQELRLPNELSFQIIVSGLFHDAGKVDERFQANLHGLPVTATRFSPTVLAKSTRHGKQVRTTMPENFRHEMLSLVAIEFADLPVDATLTKHLVASHHGFARPLAPVCDDTNPVDLDFRSLGGPMIEKNDVEKTKRTHELDSGIADRFWELHSRFGAWGLAYLETIMRLADWHASAYPFLATKQEEFNWKPSPDEDAKDFASVVLPGIDGSNPLGFLAAIGMFRTLANAEQGELLRFAWQFEQGGWRPWISDVGGELREGGEVIDRLIDALSDDLTNHASLMENPDGVARRDWFALIASSASAADRDTADWLSCNESDAAPTSAISQLQTSRRDYQAINIKGLLENTNASQLERTLLQTWDYADPIAGVSLHLEPREDRRHAYQWHTPSGDPTRKSTGGMIGANRLALEAWPMFQSLPAGEKLRTVGFKGLKANDTQFIWPIWTTPVGLATVKTILGSRAVNQKKNLNTLSHRGITEVFQSSRILVGKTPNLTPATSVARSSDERLTLEPTG